MARVVTNKYSKMSKTEKALQNKPKPVEKPKEPYVGVISEPGVIYVACRGKLDREPGKLLTSSPSDGYRAGWKVIIQSEQVLGANTYVFRYLGRDVCTPALDLSWRQVSEQFTSEMKHLPPNCKRMFLDDQDRIGKFMAKFISSCTDLRFFSYKSGPIGLHESLEPLAEQVGMIPDACPKLELIIIDYELYENDEEAADYAPFVTPEQLLRDKPTDGKAGPHNRILWTMMGMLVTLKHLKHASITFGGGLWDYHQQRTWQDFVEEMLEEGSRENMVEQLRHMMESGSEMSEEEDSEMSEEEDNQQMEEDEGLTKENDNIQTPDEDNSHSQEEGKGEKMDIED